MEGEKESAKEQKEGKEREGDRKIWMEEKVNCQKSDSLRPKSRERLG